MKNVFLPLFTTPFVILGRKTTFFATDENLIVEAPRKLMQQLATFCNGTHTTEEVIQCLNNEWDDKALRKLLEALRCKKILSDARQISEETWKTVENPSHFPSLITDKEVAMLVDQSKRRHKKNPSNSMYNISPCSLGKLLRSRRSVRLFSEKPVAIQSVINILWSAYGEIAYRESKEEIASYRRTVPSAGALYPLVISIALFKQTGDLQPAVYSVYLGHPDSVGFHSVSDDVLQFSRAFLNPIMIEKAHGVIVISGSFNVTGEKYGNRSMLYVPLEAGHAAQNIHLAAIENDVATVEVGGFVEALLTEAVNLPKHYHPLTTVVFGHKEKETQMAISNSTIEVQWTVPMAGQYRPPFALASARVSTGRNWSHGRDALPTLAHTKAIAEAKEWASCGCVPETLVQARIADLKTAIDPRDVIRFHSAQYSIKWFPFKTFNTKMKYAWTEGYDEITGSVAHILADLVYFPYFPKTPYHAYANSSGVAAHPDKQKAVETSALELVERDSFMIAYLAQLEFPSIREQTLPQEIRKRIQDLRKAGFQVWIKDHSIDLAPVVFVFAQNEEAGCSTCASCASFDIEHAVSHALMEVEALVLARLQNGRAKPIKPNEVEAPLDHGALYGQRQYFRRANFLIRGQKSIVFQDVGKHVARSWQELLDRISDKGWRLITIPLFLSDKYGGNGDLHIVRSIVPGMVPMTFGYRQEPAGMDRIYKIAKEFGHRTISYQDLPKFPHPFA